MPANVALAALVIVKLLISIRPSAFTPVAAIAPVVPALRVKLNRPTSVMMPPKLMFAPLESKVTSPLVSVVAPETVRPLKPLQFMPSKVTAPANVLAVSPLVSVTSCWNLVEPAALVETIPLAPPTVFWKSTKPVDANVIAAPVPVPMPLTTPVNVVVPAAVPAAIVKF